jgi:lipopolysaccharide transport system ATP-binding protein
MNSEFLLSVHNVGVCYRRQGTLFKESKSSFWALKDISFDLRRGEVLGVIGRNGAGKSTLLRVLAGIIRPDKGEVINNGCQPSLLSLQVGFLPYLTGRKNAILSSMLLGLKYDEIERKIGMIAEFAELGEFFDQPISTYSTGMKARLGFSVAYHAEPEVMLLDEVLGVGDENFRKRSEAAMRERIRSDKTIVLVSHNPGTLKDLCNRVVLIENGVTTFEGETGEALERYQESLAKPTPAILTD